MTKPYLSLVLACYNEEQIIEQSMKEIVDFFETLKYPYEIILIDDASRDKTQQLIKKIASKHRHVRYLFHEKNTGRGRTVTDGIFESKGEIVGFIDIDLEIPVAETLPLIKAVEKGCDIATAWRFYIFELKYLPRIVAHYGYVALSRLLLGHHFNDTEAGCKFFRRSKILKILKETKHPGWFWCTEMLVRSYYSGLKICEVPSIFRRNEDSKSTVNLFGDTLNYFISLLSFSLRAKKLCKP